MHEGEYLAVMQPNGHWHLYRVNGRFPNGALDITFIQTVRPVSTLLARTKGIPVTLPDLVNPHLPSTSSYTRQPKEGRKGICGGFARAKDGFRPPAVNI
jgi:hypothetical protein